VKKIDARYSNFFARVIRNELILNYLQALSNVRQTRKVFGKSRSLTPVKRRTIIDMRTGSKVQADLDNIRHDIRELQSLAWAAASVTGITGGSLSSNVTVKRAVSGGSEPTPYQRTTHTTEIVITENLLEDDFDSFATSIADLFGKKHGSATIMRSELDDSYTGGYKAYNVSKDVVARYLASYTCTLERDPFSQTAAATGICGCMPYAIRKTVDLKSAAYYSADDFVELAADAFDSLTKRTVIVGSYTIGYSASQTRTATFDVHYSTGGNNPYIKMVTLPTFEFDFIGGSASKHQPFMLNEELGVTSTVLGWRLISVECTDGIRTDIVFTCTVVLPTTLEWGTMDNGQTYDVGPWPLLSEIVVSMTGVLDYDVLTPPVGFDGVGGVANTTVMTIDQQFAVARTQLAAIVADLTQPHFDSPWGVVGLFGSAVLTVGSFGTNAVAKALVGLGSVSTLVASGGNAVDTGDWGSLITTALYTGSMLRGAVAGEHPALQARMAEEELAAVNLHVDTLEAAYGLGIDPYTVSEHYSYAGGHDEYIVSGYKYDGVLKRVTYQVHTPADDGIVQYNMHEAEWDGTKFTPEHPFRPSGLRVKNDKLVWSIDDIGDILEGQQRREAWEGLIMDSEGTITGEAAEAFVNGKAIAAARRAGLVPSEVLNDEAKLPQKPEFYADSESSLTTDQIALARSTGFAVFKDQKLVDEMINIAAGTDEEGRFMRGLLKNLTEEKSLMNTAKVSINLIRKYPELSKYIGYTVSTVSPQLTNVAIGAVNKVITRYLGI
jgi:hypothetical protein